jgi:hypothetical protein
MSLERCGLGEIEVEVGEFAGVGDEVDLGDAALFDREGDDGDWSLAWKDDDAGVAVDDRGPGVPGQPGAARDDTAGDVLGSFDRSAVAGPAGVSSEDDAGVEDFEERFEVAVPGGGEEGVHDASLLA